MVVYYSRATFVPCADRWKFIRSISSSATAMLSIVKKIHPDLFYSLNDSNICEANRNTITTMMEIWNKLIIFNKMLPHTILLEDKDEREKKLRLLNYFDNRASDPLWNTLSKYDKNQRILVPRHHLMNATYELSCYYYTNSATLPNVLTSKKLVKNLPIKIRTPSSLSTASASVNTQQEVPAVHIVFDMLSILQQQKKIYEQLSVPFPLSNSVKIMEDFLDQTQAGISPSSSFNKSSLPLSQELYNELYDRIVVQRHYLSKSRDFKHFLDTHKTKSMNMECNRSLRKRKSNSYENIWSDLYPQKNLYSPLKMAHVNYYLSKKHVWFEAVPPNEEISLLVAFRDFLLKYYDFLQFSPHTFGKVHFLIYGNGKVRSRKSSLLYEIVQPCESESSISKSVQLFDEEMRQSCIIRIPHNWHESVLLSFLQSKSLATANKNSFS
jgi:hypothetical protein